MIKFFVIAWITVTLPNLPSTTDWIVNTSLYFDSQHDCEIYTGLEEMTLTIGVERYIESRFPGASLEITEIGCVSQGKLEEMDKIRNN